MIKTPTYKTDLNKDLIEPADLCKEGKKACNTILKFLTKKSMTYTGGCKAFYSPQEWQARGEMYGECSVLVVVHDGGDLASVFNLDYEAYSLYDKMWQVLDKAGFYSEQLTSWCTAIYKK